MNEFSDAQQSSLTEGNISRQLKQEKWDLYSRFPKVKTEISQRANLIPEKWLWFTSGSRPDDVTYLSPRLEADRTMSVGKDHHNVLWTKIVPTDHNGEYNTYSSQGAEICVIAPEQYIVDDPDVFSSPSGVNFDRGDFYLVGVQDVEIHDPNTQGGLSFKTRRYSVVPTDYVDAYYRALGKEDRAVVYDSRVVDVPIREQKVVDEDTFKLGNQGVQLKGLPVYTRIPASQKELDFELTKYPINEQVLIKYLHQLYKDGKLDTIFGDGKKM